MRLIAVEAETPKKGGPLPDISSEMSDFYSGGVEEGLAKKSTQERKKMVETVQFLMKSSASPLNKLNVPVYKDPEHFSPWIDKFTGGEYDAFPCVFIDLAGYANATGTPKEVKEWLKYMTTSLMRMRVPMTVELTIYGGKKSILGVVLPCDNTGSVPNFAKQIMANGGQAIESTAPANFTHGAYECAMDMANGRELKKAYEETSMFDKVLMAGGAAILMGSAASSIARWYEKKRGVKTKGISKAEAKAAAKKDEIKMRWPAAMREKLYKDAVAEAKKVIHSLPVGFQRGLGIDTQSDLIQEFLDGDSNDCPLVEYDLFDIAKYYGVDARDIGEANVMSAKGDVNVTDEWTKAFGAICKIGETLQKMGYDVAVECTGDWDDGTFDIVLH